MKLSIVDLSTVIPDDLEKVLLLYLSNLYYQAWLYYCYEKKT